MRQSPLLVATLLGSILPACAGTETPNGASDELVLTERPDEPGTTRASREAAEEIAAGAEGTVALRPGAAPTPDAPSIRVAPVDADEGEDGSGQVVSATRPVAIDLDAHRFPPRALDPVLHVGSLRFVHYTHPRPGVLRFVVADAALLPAGAEVAVQYGDDVSTRVVVASSLEGVR